VQLESEFEKRWANGEIPGWGNKGTEKEFGIDLDYYSTVEELVELSQKN
jgi:splicing factor 3A subunit 3